MGKAIEVRKLRADKKSFVLTEPLCSRDGVEGGKIDEEDKAQVTEGFDCQAEGLALFFFSVGRGETQKVLYKGVI